jgi:hypothetical protein
MLIDLMVNKEVVTIVQHISWLVCEHIRKRRNQPTSASNVQKSNYTGATLTMLKSLLSTIIAEAGSRTGSVNHSTKANGP